MLFFSLQSLKRRSSLDQKRFSSSSFQNSHFVVYSSKNVSQGAFWYLCYARKNIQFSTIRWLNVEKLISSHIFVLLFFHQKLSQKLSSSCQSIKLFGIPNHFQTDHLQSAHKRHGFGFRNLRSESQFVITIYHLLLLMVFSFFFCASFRWRLEDSWYRWCFHPFKTP